MKNIKMKIIWENKKLGNIIIIVALTLLIYLLVSLYFINHFFFNTEVNGINLSLKSISASEKIIREEVEGYKINLIGRDGRTEEIKGEEIDFKYNNKNSLKNIYKKQSYLKWIKSLIKKEEYYLEDLLLFNKTKLDNKVESLKILNEEIIEPKNIVFKFGKENYGIIKEVEGNKIDKEKLSQAIEIKLLMMKKDLDINENSCYENPTYTLDSKKTLETHKLLNQYVQSKITYVFEEKEEILDGETINKWLTVNEDLDLVINEKLVREYIKDLSKKYNTVGITRNFKTSIGKIVEVKGGYYGWKINTEDETKELLENIKLGKTIEKEPIYTQEGLDRGENDIGDTYVEINITKQHLWFYKDKKLITQGDIVTGDPNKGYSTKVGTYMLNYKEKESTLTGPNYEAKVKYWMPFNGNIGIHDASWRYSFGGEIYKRNGTHGCVNSPLYLAKTIFENIEEGTPVICYEE